MVTWLAATLLLAAEAFWNAKPPADWSIEEVRQMMLQSPWSTLSKATSGPPVHIHLASAEPMQVAEALERQAQRYRFEPGANFEDYVAMLKEGRYIVIAVLQRDLSASTDSIEAKSMERDSILHIGRRSYKLVTHFPPTAGDPYLRYVFPRDVKPNDKALHFELYIPGIVYPQRHIEFDFREMMYKGKLAY